MEKISKQLLNDLVSRIVSEIHPERIYLFGSQARASADENSDIDLLVVTSDDFGADNSRREQMKRIRHSLANIHISKDILVFTTHEIAKWRNSVNHIIHQALNEGILLYERR